MIIENLFQERRRILNKEAPEGMLNVMSIDLEDWFQVSNFEKNIERADWDQLTPRIQETFPRLLDIFSEYQVRATFFTLGWIAKRYPHLIRRAHNEGHEIASHGDEHRRVTTMTPDEFSRQLIQSKDTIEQIIGERVDGHRAPSYSFRKETSWAIDLLLEAGFLYDSSIFPFGPRRDPSLCTSNNPCHLLASNGEAITEYPLSIVNLYGMPMPIAGGGYFRFLPYYIVKQGIEKINRENIPAIMYFHPWEIDPFQPRVPNASRLAKFRHYHNLDTTESKIIRLVKDFQFASFRDIFWDEKNGNYATSVKI